MPLKKSRHKAINIRIMVSVYPLFGLSCPFHSLQYTSNLCKGFTASITFIYIYIYRHSCMYGIILLRVRVDLFYATICVYICFCISV